MGAEPAWITLALTLPELNENWLKAFSQGLAKLAKKYNIQLVGGDTTRGPLTISIQVHGFVKPVMALRRSGAKVGDVIYVTGTLGDAGAALQLQLQKWDHLSLTADDKIYLRQRLEQPTPRLEIGQQLVGLATSAVDISDGLIADLGHILNVSGVGARLDLTKLPLSAAMSKVDRKVAEHFALQSGDDYELCFTVPSEYSSQIEQRFEGLCTRIGIITDDEGIYFIDDDDALIALKGTGYDHFPI
jgi:thiamine-monophosphate kinase